MSYARQLLCVLVLSVGCTLGPAPGVAFGKDEPVPGRMAATLSGRISHYVPKPGASVSLYAIPSRGGHSTLGEATADPEARMVLVKAWRGGGTPVAQVVASGLGEFKFTGLGPGLHVVRFDDGAGAQDLALVEVPLLGGDLKVDLQGRRGGPLFRGTVREAQGAPSARTVLLVDLNASGIQKPVTSVYGPSVTGVDGEFALPHPPPGEYLVIVMGDGGTEWYFRPLSLPRSRQLVLDVPARTRELRGQVKSQAGARGGEGASMLFIGQYNQGDGARRFASVFSVAATADEDGRYSIRVPDDPMQVLVLPKTGAPWVQAVPSTTTVLDVPLRLGGGLVVKTVQEDGGEPVGGVHVCAMKVVSEGPPVFRVAVSDVRGAASFPDLPEGSYAIWPCDERWAASPQRTRRPPLEEPPLVAEVLAQRKDVVKLAVHPAVTLTCEVVDVTGTAVPNAWVRAWDTAWMSWRPGTRPHRTLKTDAKGRVEMTGFPRGTQVVVTAIGEKGGFAANERVVLDGSTPVRLTLDPPLWMEVEVVGEDGSSLPDDAWISWGGGGWGSTPHHPVGSDFLIEGRARIGPLAHGALQVEVGGTGFLRAFESMRSLSDATEKTPLRITLVREKRVSGRVVLPKGLSSSDVELTQEGGARSWFQQNGSVVEIDNRGRFEIGGLANQTLKLEALAMRGDRVWVGEGRAIAGAEDVEVALRELRPEPGSGTWLLRVRDPEGKEVLDSVASIGAWPRGPRTGLLNTYSRMRHRHGRAVAWGRPEDKPVFFCVRRAQGDAGEPLPYAEVVVGPKSEAGGVVDVVLAPERILRGRLVDAGGKPMTNWSISIERYLDEFKPRLVDYSVRRGETPVDEDGYFSLRGLGRFRYRLSAMPDEGGAALMRDVGKDEDSLAWTVPAKSVSRVRVMDRDGEPVAGALVETSDSRDRLHGGGRWQDLRIGSFFYGAETDARGVAELHGLEVGIDYRLLVRPPEGREDLTGTALAKFDPKSETEVRLPPGRSIRGRVTTPDGMPMPAVSVVCDIGAGVIEATTKLADGTFVLRAVPLREVSVWAQLTDPKARGAVVRVAVGAGDVALSVDPGRQIVVRIERWDLVKRRLTRWIPTGQSSRQRLGPAIRLTSHDDRVPFSVTASPNDAGIVRFHSLPEAGHITLWGGTTRDGEYLYVPALKPSNSVVETGLQRGRTLKGRVQVPEGVVADRVIAKLRGAVVVGAVESDHSFRIRGVPPGDAVVVLWGRRENEAPLQYDAEGTPVNRAAEGVFRGEQRVVETTGISIRLDPLAAASGADAVAAQVMSILTETRGPDAYKDYRGRIRRLLALGVEAKPHLFSAIRGTGQRGRHDPRAQAAGAALAELVTRDDLPQIAFMLKRGYVAVAPCLRELRSAQAMRALAAAIRAGHFGHQIATALAAQEPLPETTEAVREWIRRPPSRESRVINPAAEYLAQIGDYESVPLIESALDAIPAGYERTTLACTLAALGLPRSVEELIEILDAEGDDSFGVQERRRAAGTLQMVMEGEGLPGASHFPSDDLDEAAIKKEAASWMKRAEGKLRFDRKARRWFIEGDQPTEADLATMQGATEFKVLVLEVRAPKEVKKGEAFKATLTVRNAGSVAIKNVTVHLAVAERFSGAGKNSAHKSIKHLEAGGSATYVADFTVTAPGYYGVDGAAWDRDRMVSAAFFRVAVLPMPDGSYPVLNGASKRWAAASHSGALRVRMYAPPGMKAGRKARFLLEVRNESSFAIKDCAMHLFAPPTIRGADGARRRTKISAIAPDERYLAWISLTPMKPGAQSLQVRVQGSGQRVSGSCKLEFAVGER